MGHPNRTDDAGAFPGTMRSCCKDPSNRSPGPSPRRATPELLEDESLEHCLKCAAHHYELKADPLTIGLVFSDI